VLASKLDNTDAWGEPISPKSKIREIDDLGPELERL
jgi:hypothetical protein